MLEEFKKFAVRGNVVDMAGGIIIWAAFGKTVNSLVNDLMMPPLGRALGLERLGRGGFAVRFGAHLGVRLIIGAAGKIVFAVFVPGFDGFGIGRKSALVIEEEAAYAVYFVENDVRDSPIELSFGPPAE